ncbi:YbfB/YjiJ family MFS transporter [Stappia sp. GBMRC 2046]|uniref:YbfB/YjiJ family MFS transporter n=1 Tax=Stappia sediminis TaxID=2692190 RepID=A0A7X3LVF1_9HYPH|nr:YbfB/YjiJ family MFS transporter [Stappia sediminis]MXN65752.1 YbfB/YjiJ family MFS transporter [Stappia sediminis]
MKPAPGSPVLLALAGFLALATAMGIGRFALTPILPFMIEGIPLSTADAGFIASANYLGYLIGALGASALPSFGDGRGWFFLGLVLTVLLAAGMGVSGDLTYLAVDRFIAGLASALVLVFSATLIIEPVTRMGRPELVAVQFGGVGFGIMLSAGLVGLLGAHQAGWDTMWLLSGALALVAVALIAFLVPAREKAAPSPARPVDTANGRHRSALLKLTLAYGLFGFGYIITGTFLTTILRGSSHLRHLEAPVWAMVGFAASFSLWFWGRVAARIGNSRAFAIACMVEAVAVLLTVVSAAPLAFFVAAFLFGGTFVGITGVGLVEARRMSRANPARSFGLMTSSFGLGQALGPTAAGIGAEMTGSFALPSLAAVATLVVATLLTFNLPRD